MIRVLHLVGSSKAGGVETFLLDLARHIDSSNFRLTVCVPEGHGRVPRLLESAGAEVHSVPLARGGLAAARSLFRVLRADPWDVVHANVGGAFLRLALKAMRHRPILTHVHGLPDSWKGVSRDHDLSESRTARRTFGMGSDAILVSSRYMTATMQHLLGGMSDRLRYIPLGVDLVRFRPRPRGDDEIVALGQEIGLGSDEPTIGFVGRLVEQKGIDTFVRAARVVLTGLPAARCIVIGDGPLRTAFVDLVREFGERRCVLLGERWDANLWMARIDLLLLPSAWEPFGLVAAEAMACGCPVVASDFQGFSETIVSGRTGFLVTPGDAEGFAGAALEILGSPSLREALSRQARHHVEANFPVAQTVKELETCYREYAARRS